MPQTTLTVHFRGICTHFRGVVPGVPHRTVIPDASPMRSGRVKVGDRPVEQYTLPPHYPVIGADKIEIPGFIEKRKIVNGVRMEIVNAIGPLCYDKEEFERIPALADYVDQYRPSTEVVHGGRARCYFDVFRGHVSSELRGKERHATIKMWTDGKPVLQVTPLVFEPPQSPSVWTFELDSDTLVFMNGTKACGGPYSSHDFLLNYLTEQGGIPHAVSSDFPLGELIAGNDDAGLRHFTSEEDFVPPPAEELTRCVHNEGELVMCSDSRYP